MMWGSAATLAALASLSALCNACPGAWALVLEPAASTLEPPLRIMVSTDPNHNDVIVRRVNDTLTLVCQDIQNLGEVTWYLPSTDTPYRGNGSDRLSVSGGQLTITGLRLADRGHYTCHGHIYTATKYLVVQEMAPTSCSRGGFSCGLHCVLPFFVCDGHADCPRGEDENYTTCGTSDPCVGKLSCGDGRCISGAWCASSAARPACCDLHAPPSPPDPLRPDLAHIQSTIYTVTACALMFMVAVVLLVSAVCKMHMKRAALRSYRAVQRHAASPYRLPPLPPCYTQREQLPHALFDGEDELELNVETDRDPWGGGSPAHDNALRRLLRQYRMETAYGQPSDAALRDDSVTLRLGRWRVSVPRLARTRSGAPRPDTPDIEEPTALDELLCGETYTLNGRTIRLLGAELRRPPAPPAYRVCDPDKCGPPPVYLSRDDLIADPDIDNNPAASTSDNYAPDCNGNPEPPPQYETLPRPTHAIQQTHTTASIGNLVGNGNTYENNTDNNSDNNLVDNERTENTVDTETDAREDAHTVTLVSTDTDHNANTTTT